MRGRLRDDDPWRLMCFSRPEPSTSHDRNGKQRKILRRDVVIFDGNRVGTPGSREFRDAKVVTQRRALRLRYFDDSREALKPFPKTLRKMRGPHRIVALSS